VRNVVLVGLGFALLIVQATFATMVPIHAIAPNLLLPLVIYFGVAPDMHVLRGASLSFVLGYLLDSFCGSPMGLLTFVMVATFILARFAGLRLFMRGPAFQVLLTFVVGLIAGGTVFALRAIFEAPPPFPAGDAWSIGVAIAVPALSTAIAAPLVFVAVWRVDGLVSHRREEKATIQ
jgi:rod shape-determining protein MreD